MKVFGRGHDPKIGATIMHLISELFLAYPDSILAYVCSALDQQDRHRQILFAKWYNASSLKEGFIFIRKKIYDNYCGVIYSASHPAVFEIGDAFFDFDLDNKPEVWEEEEFYFFDEDE
ncbi:MAG: hypothetical protein K0S33_212 [Bacteroidetes bacterium]|jgi:hypothetical protein|nr:hypothetical protein [Bacteroidota bacterium]